MPVKDTIYRGHQGAQGIQGAQGRQGYRGHQGVPGESVYGGAQGDQGYQGDDGVQGFQGHQGRQGSQGAIGVGSQGSQGASGATTDIAWNEVPSGLVNDVNVTYGLVNAPVAGKHMVFKNGLLMKNGDDYTIAGSTITFAEAPRTADVLLCTYQF